MIYQFIVGEKIVFLNVRIREHQIATQRAETTNCGLVENV